MGNWCAGSYPRVFKTVHFEGMPVIEVLVDGRIMTALVDTGCKKSIAEVNECKKLDVRPRDVIVAFNGSEIVGSGLCVVDMVVNDKRISLEVLVTKKIVRGIDIILGLDFIKLMGGVYVNESIVRFGEGERREWSLNAASTLSAIETIVDKDFVANFDGSCWTVNWVWKDEQEPKLQNKIALYTNNVKDSKKAAFEEEVERWIREGILEPWTEKVEAGILPLMAVEQPTKNKVRPVIDYRELITYIECHTGDEFIDVCGEKLREWRKAEGELALVDLKSAYLQIKVHPSLWKYQLVNYKGTTYCLTRLGFGLNCAPRIMSRILKTVLTKSEIVGKATSSYIDDILVKTTELPAVDLQKHLHQFGLETKPPEMLDGGAVLGLKLSLGSDGNLKFGRGNDLPILSDHCTRRQLFSLCGKLIGHYPVAGWLRLACSFIKRHAEGHSWEEDIGGTAQLMIREVLQRVNEEDPVSGVWHVSQDSKATVWCDASSIALGVVLEVEGTVVEDAAWLRKKGDSEHINVAELDSVLKGVNLSLLWGYKDLKIYTDSATVYNWIKISLSQERRIRTKGAAELLIKRRLGTLQSLVSEFNLNLDIELVVTNKNKADALTRVPKKWLVLTKRGVACDDPTVCCVGVSDVRSLHEMHHFGIDRSLYLTRQLYPDVKREVVEGVVRSCTKCQMIDPAPVSHTAGELNVEGTWVRMAIDVTHFRDNLYLTMIDCGPGRFALWRVLSVETAEVIANQVESVFEERGPVAEILLDNATVFRARAFVDMCARWNVARIFRAAYRPQGNGIIERHHRTIKSIAERGNTSPQRAVFWYNFTPRKQMEDESVLYKSVYNYEWRHPASTPANCSVEPDAGVELGEEVWVKPPKARCTSHWNKGVVSSVNSGNNVSVDGIPRHVLDIRKIVLPVEDVDKCDDATNEAADPDRRSDAESSDKQDEGDQSVPVRRVRPQRERKPPVWLRDYVA